MKFSVQKFTVLCYLLVSFCGLVLIIWVKFSHFSIGHVLFSGLCSIREVLN